jgi:hypothetical protein
MAHEVERHGQDGLGDAVEVDLAPFAGAAVDRAGLDRRVLDDPPAHLGRGHPAVGQQAREAGGDDRAEAGLPVAEAAEQLEQVAAESSGVGGLHLVRCSVVDDGGEHQLVLVRPTAVQHRDPGLGPRRDRLHRQAGEPDRRQLLPGGVEQSALELLAPAAVSDLIGHDHEPTHPFKRGLHSLLS